MKKRKNPAAGMAYGGIGGESALLDVLMMSLISKLPLQDKRDLLRFINERLAVTKQILEDRERQTELPELDAGGKE